MRKYDELLTESEVLDHEVAAPPHRSLKRAEHDREELEYRGAASTRVGRSVNRAT